MNRRGLVDRPPELFGSREGAQVFSIKAGRRNRRAHATAAVLAVGALFLAGCSDPLNGDGADSEADPAGPVVVSSANFVESEIIGNLFAEVLQANGVEVETNFNIGSREAYIPALGDGSIDLIPEYTGNLLLYLNPEADVSIDADVEGELAALLGEEGLAMLTPAEAEDTDSLTVTKDLAEQWNLESIADLVPHNDELVVAGMPEFNERARGLPGLEELYGLSPAEFMPISDGGGPATVQALLDGTAHAANIFTTSPAIVENDLVVLEDPEGNFPQQFVVPVMNADLVTPEIEEALNSVTAKLTTSELLELNRLVSGDEKVEPRDAAVHWLTDQGLV